MIKLQINQIIILMNVVILPLNVKKKKVKVLINGPISKKFSKEKIRWDDRIFCIKNMEIKIRKLC